MWNKPMREIHFFKIIVFIFISLLGLASMTSEAKEYDYTVEAGYPLNYPMQYSYNNYLTDAKGNRLLNFFPAGGGATYFGSGTQATLASERNPLPHGIHVQWFSVVENCFWEGDYVFNQNILNNLTHYTVLDILNRSTDRFTDIFGFTVYVAPGGLVSVWVSGGGEKFLVAQFQAKKMVVEPQWEVFYKSTQYSWYMPREEFRTFMMEGMDDYIKKSFKGKAERFNTVQTGTLTSIPWQAAMKTYPWYLTINDPYFTLRDYVANYVNGEFKYTYFDDNQLAKNRAVPYQISYYYQEKQNNNKLTRGMITFDADEIMQGFKKMNLTPPLDAPINLYLDFNDKSLSAYLVKGNQKLELTKISAERPDLYNAGVDEPWPEQIKRYK